MLDITAQYDSFRKALLKCFPTVYSHWPLLHVVLPGPTRAENYDGVGPWARIWSIPQGLPANFSIDTDATCAGRIWYLVAVYVPRVYTTDDIAETLIHEYLHVGRERGSLVYHPPRDETAFIARSRSLARSAKIELSHELEALPAISADWSRLSQLRPQGLTLSPSELRKTVTLGCLPHTRRMLDLGALS